MMPPFFFPTERTFCDRSLMPRDHFRRQVFNVRASFPPPDLGIFGCLFSTHPNIHLWNHIHRSSAAAAQNVESKSHSRSSCPGVVRAEQPQRRRDKLPVSTCMRPAETENSGWVNYLARRASPCCSHRRARLQMLRHLRRAVEEPLSARPRCSSDDSAQARGVGSARGSQLSCKKVFVVKERKKHLTDIDRAGIDPLDSFLNWQKRRRSKQDHQ